jgi:hypothetical protein
MRFGLGIRPSLTISSNLVAPTPMYSAACIRDRPRGARDGGRQLTEFRLTEIGAISSPPRLPWDNLDNRPRSIARRTTLVTNAGQPAAATPIGRSFWRAGTANAEMPAGKSALLDLQPFPRIPDAAPHGPGAPRVGATMRGHRATNNSVPIVTALDRTSESDFGAPLPAPEGHIGRLDQHAQLIAIDIALFRRRTAASHQVIALAAEWLIFSAPGKRPLMASWTERRLRPVVASGPDDLRAMRLM